MDPDNEEDEDFFVTDAAPAAAAVDEADAAEVGTDE